MDVVQVGIDHHLAPLSVRERLAMSGDTLEGVMQDIHSLPWADEIVVLSTCNRTELYAVSRMHGASDLALDALLAHLPNAPDPKQVGYRRQSGEAAARHLLRVACGLESAVLGETEIQGQVKSAHTKSRSLRTIGPVLERLCQTSLRAGKRARTETEISDGGVSHGSAAVDIVSRIFAQMSRRTVLIVGAGVIAKQVARAFAPLDGIRFVLANRTTENAEALARDLALSRVEVVGLDEIPELLKTVHVAVFATGAEPVPADTVAKAASKRRDPLVVVDMGLPRCVSPEASDLPGVFLYDLEDLEQWVSGALAKRRESVTGVESIVIEEFGRFQSWYRTLAALPTIRSLNTWADGIRAEELAYVADDLPPELRARIDELTRRLVRRLLGRPTGRVVKGAEAEDPNLPTAQHLKHVFGLDDESTARPKDGE